MKFHFSKALPGSVLTSNAFTKGVLALMTAGFFLSGSCLAQAADMLSDQQFEERYSGQAVSGLNFKVDAGYFVTDFSESENDAAEFSSAHGYRIEGAVSVPIGPAFGLQIDAGFVDAAIDGVSGAEDFGFTAHGIGGHLFWRDPSIGLIGLYAHHSEYEFTNGAGDLLTNTRYGVEGEAYLGNFTIKGFAGQDELDWNFAEGRETYLAGKADLDFYITENFMISAGIEHAFEQTTGKLGIEAMADFGRIATSLYADASFGVDTQTITGGIKLYVGPASKSLKARHREDDPASDLFGNFGAMGGCMNKALDVDMGFEFGAYPTKVLGPGVFTLPPGMGSLEDGIELDGCSSKPG